MMEIMSWVQPLLLLPGVGLLLMSTSFRFESVHAEIHALLRSDMAGVSDCALHSSVRGRLLVLAMVLLYLATASFGVSGLFGALEDRATGHGGGWWVVLLAAGVVALVLAAVILVIESWVTARVIVHHAREIQRGGTKVES